MKQKRIESKKARDSARGEDCTLNIVGVCNHDPSTTVLAHLPDDSGCGKMGGKSDDVGCAVYACSACHDILDERKKMTDFGAIDNNEWVSWEDFHMLRALKRTIRRMIEKNILEVK